jgi:hypothetical protein
MRRSAVVLLALSLLVRPAAASEESIHNWTKAIVVADTDSFGDVEVRATGSRGATPRVQSITVKTEKTTIPISKAFVKSLPAMRLNTVQVHTEAGYDPDPWLYVVFETTASGTSAKVKGQWVHFAIQSGRLVHASIKTQGASGQFKFETRKLPRTR